MAATGVQLNWTAVGFTPSGGSLTPITRVTNVDFTPGGSLIAFSGDNNRFPTVIANAMNAPRCTITTANIGLILGIAPGTVGTVGATHKDAIGGSNGDIVYVLSNAVVENTSGSGPHGQFGSGTISFQAFSSDGTTNPLAFTRA